MILRLIYVECLKDATDEQLRKQAENIIKYFFWANAGGTQFGIDWPTMRGQFPDLCEYYDKLKTEWLERYPAPTTFHGLTDNEKKLLDEHKKVHAVKAIRERTGKGLMESVEICREYYKSMGKDWHEIIQGCQFTVTEIDHLYQYATNNDTGGKVKAIKAYRERTGKQLIDCIKDTREYMESRNWKW